MLLMIDPPGGGVEVGVGGGVVVTSIDSLELSGGVAALAAMLLNDSMASNRVKMIKGRAFFIDPSGRMGR